MPWDGCVVTMTNTPLPSWGSEAEWRAGYERNKHNYAYNWKCDSWSEGDQQSGMLENAIEHVISTKGGEFKSEKPVPGSGLKAQTCRMGKERSQRRRGGKWVCGDGGQDVPGRMCKDPEAGRSLVGWRTWEKANVSLPLREKRNTLPFSWKSQEYTEWWWSAWSSRVGERERDRDREKRLGERSKKQRLKISR